MHVLRFRQEVVHFLQVWCQPSRSLLPCCHPHPPPQISRPLCYRLTGLSPSLVFYPFYRHRHRRWGRVRLRWRCWGRGGCWWFPCSQAEIWCWVWCFRWRTCLWSCQCSSLHFCWIPRERWSCRAWGRFHSWPLLPCPCWKAGRWFRWLRWQERREWWGCWTWWRPCSSSAPVGQWFPPKAAPSWRAPAQQGPHQLLVPPSASSFDYSAGIK